MYVLKPTIVAYLRIIIILYGITNTYNKVNTITTLIKYTYEHSVHMFEHLGEVSNGFPQNKIAIY